MFNARLNPNTFLKCVPTIEDYFDLPKRSSLELLRNFRKRIQHKQELITKWNSMRARLTQKNHVDILLKPIV